MDTMNVGVRELKQHLSKYLDLVRQGESVTVTDRGRPVARLEQFIPDDLPSHVKQLIAEGKIIYRKPRVGPLPPAIRLLPGDKTGADYVREQRR